MKTLNIKFPLVDDVEKNTALGMNTVTKEALKSNLMLLMLTDKGERYYNPDYGTNIKKYIFEPNDGITLGEIESDIKNTVKTYIPQLTVTKVAILGNGDTTDDGDILGEHEIRVVVSFSYAEDVFSKGGNLEISFNI